MQEVAECQVPERRVTKRRVSASHINIANLQWAGQCSRITCRMRHEYKKATHARIGGGHSWPLPFGGDASEVMSTRHLCHARPHDQICCCRTSYVAMHAQRSLLTCSASTQQSRGHSPLAHKFFAANTIPCSCICCSEFASRLLASA